MLSICQNPELSPQGPFIQQLWPMSPRQPNETAKNLDAPASDWKTGLATAWKEHYECLSNVEFNWDPNFLTGLSLPRRRPGNPHTTWAGDQGHQYDEMWQGCWYTPDRSWNLESLLNWRGLADPWSNRGYHPFQEEHYWMGAEYHRLSL